jgi:hypothetical protein
MTDKEENLKVEKTVIVAFDDADYSRLQMIADNLGIALSTFVEDATIMRINQMKGQGEWITG